MQYLKDKKKKTKAGIACTCECSVTVGDLDLSLPSLRPHHEKSVDTLSKALYRFMVWFDILKKKIPEGLCSLFQVNDLTFGRNASRKESGHISGYLRLCAHTCCGPRRISSLHSAAEFCTFPRQCFEPLRSARRVRARSLSEMLLFDLAGTGLPTESRDCAVSVEHKQTVGWIRRVRHRPPLCSHSDGTFWQASHKQRKSIVFYCVTYLFWEITSASSIILATVQRHTLQEGDTINH